ncbi:hypothetical protein FOCC_FOCC004662 [Frankliniella occidentalis]|nr:hypothetical protein FOCC_FOCC004662 [Frankliniella occidentalis]
MGHSKFQWLVYSIFVGKLNFSQRARKLAAVNLILAKAYRTATGAQPAHSPGTAPGVPEQPQCDARRGAPVRPLRRGDRETILHEDEEENRALRLMLHTDSNAQHGLHKYEEWNEEPSEDSLFLDAKEKFLSLERERLEEQERVMQLNLEKRRSGPQQPPLHQQQSAPQSPHSPPIVEPPISPAMGPCPRPRPRPRRPSWSRSRDDSEDEVPDSGNHHASRYYPDDDEDDDVDFSGNALPTGGRQRIIAAVNRRMSRESLEDDVDDFAPQPTRSAPTSRSGPPRHEYPAGYRGGDVPARSDHPARDHPGRDHPVRDHPVREHPVRDHPNRDHPSRDHPARDHPARDHPARDHPTRDHPTRDHPNRDHPTRDHPAREHPIRDHSGRDQIPRVEHPNRGDHSSRGDHPARSDNPARPDHPVRDLPGRDYPGREPPVRDHPSRDHPGRDHPARGEHPGREQPSRGSGGDLRAAVSRSRSVHRDRALEDRFRSPARGYPYPMEPLMDEGQRYRIPYNEDMDIPLERYRSSNNPQPRPPGPPLGPPLGPRHPYPREHDDDEPPHPRGDPRAYLADKKRRSVFEALEEERRRHSNELAQEFKRRSYQELDERERYPGLDRETAREPGPPGPPPGHRTQVSARYRHSYAEPPPRHHDLLHRANSAASSPRVGIAAVHPY